MHKHTRLCVSPFVGILGFDGIFVVCVKKIPNSGAFHRLYIQSKIVEKPQLGVSAFVGIL